MRIDSLSVLRMSYMPFLNNGGLFVSVAQPEAVGAKTRKSMYGMQSNAGVETAKGTTAKLLEACRFDAAVCLLLQLLDEPEQFFTIAKVAWVTPVQLRDGKRRGVGLQFQKNDRRIRAAIESRLSASPATSAGISQHSQTL